MNYITFERGLMDAGKTAITDKYFIAKIILEKNYVIASKVLEVIPVCSAGFHFIHVIKLSIFFLCLILNICMKLTLV